MKTEHSRGFVSGIIVTTLVFALSISAMAAYQKQATLDYTGIKITLDGKAVTPTDASGNAVEPFAIEGTTYLPVRGIASAMGLDVGWDQLSQTVTLTSKGGAPATQPTSNQPSGTYSRTNPAPVGTAQSVTVDNILENYTASAVILESYRGEDAQKMVLDANPFNSKPEDGKEYIVLKIKLSLDSVEGDKAISFSSYSFTPYSSSNTEYASFLTVAPSPQFSGSLYEGGTLEGYAVYTVDQSDKAPKLVFGANYDGTGGIWFSMAE